MLTLGIDDAGRGPLIGPMVLAGCLLDEKSESELRSLGVKDSKQLTPKRRELLAEKIKEKAETFEIQIIPPSVIDGEGEKRTKLNEIEAEACANIINKINKGFKKIKVFIDCPSVNIRNWTDTLKQKVENLSNLEISCEHKADRNHISVSAASILAKETREKEMSFLREKYGNNIGSGYSSDALTREFLEKNIEKLQNEGIFRQTWSTWKKAFSAKEQKKLNDFNSN